MKKIGEKKIIAVRHSWPWGNHIAYECTFPNSTSYENYQNWCSKFTVVFRGLVFYIWCPIQPCAGWVTASPRPVLEINESKRRKLPVMHKHTHVRHIPNCTCGEHLWIVYCLYPYLVQPRYVIRRTRTMLRTVGYWFGLIYGMRCTVF